MLSQTGGHGDAWWACGSSIDLMPAHPGRPPGVVDGPKEMRRRTREVIRAGAETSPRREASCLREMTRGTPHFDDTELGVLTAEAAAARLPIMAHKHARRQGRRSCQGAIYRTWHLPR